MAVRDIELFLKHLTMLSLLNFQVLQIAKMMQLFSQFLHISSVLEWMNYPSVSLKK